MEGFTLAKNVPAALSVCDNACGSLILEIDPFLSDAPRQFHPTKRSAHGLVLFTIGKYRGDRRSIQSHRPGS